MPTRSRKAQVRSAEQFAAWREAGEPMQITLGRAWELTAGRVGFRGDPDLINLSTVAYALEGVMNRA